jgi:hypothetical protein
MRYWVVGEFGSGDEVKRALTRLRELGYAKETLDVFSPYPVDGVDELLELPESPVRPIALGAGLTGAAFGYVVQWWCNAVDWPLNVGNRPPHSAPAFVPITFESLVLFAALAIFLGLLWLWRFPRPHHPLFELESFRTASTGGFWVSVTLEDAARTGPTLGHLQALEARTASVVEERT